MPANGRWDLIRRLKVNERAEGFTSTTLGVTLDYVRIVHAVGCEVSFSRLCEAKVAERQNTQ